MKLLRWTVIATIFILGASFSLPAFAAMKKAAKKTPVVHTVLIQNFAFSPALITIKKGEKVVFVQKDKIGHTVTADEQAGAVSPPLLHSKLLSEGEKYTVIFSTAGTFSYHCVPHPSMKGTVVVTGK